MGIDISENKIIALNTQYEHRVITSTNKNLKVSIIGKKTS